MAAPVKSLICTIARGLYPMTNKTLGPVSVGFNNVVSRNSSFRSSRETLPAEQYPEVEVVHNPPEWKYVERVLAPLTIPKPEKRDEYPSGWRWPTATEKDTTELKYFVARTKNHMVPVYLKTGFRGLRRITVIRRVQGDIWALERELRALVEKERGRKCASRVNEMSQQIQFHGDYEDIIRDYLKEQGF